MTPIMNSKIFVKIYFFLALLCYGFFLKYSFTHLDAWSHPSTWLNWYVNIVGLCGVFFYAFSKKSISPIFWRISLIVMISVYAYQLFDNGLFSANASTIAKTTTLANYIFLVIPLLLAVFFNAKTNRAPQ